MYIGNWKWKSNAVPHFSIVAIINCVDYFKIPSKLNSITFYINQKFANVVIFVHSRRLKKANAFPFI